MAQFLDILTKFSNLILAVITGVYAFLTWKMVSEMRKARENQVDANLIALPVGLGLIYVQVELQNAGPGPAFDVEISISLDPLLDTPERVWKHPALLVGQTEFFLLPGKDIEALRVLAERHNNLVIKLGWNNAFGHHKSTSAAYNLHNLAEGWYNAGRLMPPDDIPTQLKETTEVLEKIQGDLENILRVLKK